MLSVFEPEIGEDEIACVVDALKKGEISGSFGGYIPEFEKKFAEFCDCKYGVAVSNGTTALHISLAALEIKPGDEVLMNACTNIATALAAYHQGAVSVSVDSEPDTWNLDLNHMESLITPKTKVILPVHIYGHPVDMDALNKIAKKHNLYVVEDCAEAHGATVRGKKVGGLSDLGCFSFYANKIITTGEGGMVVTNNKDLADRLKLLRNLAFGTPRFLHQYPGFNFRMTGMQAALGVAQMKKIDRFIKEHRDLAAMYNHHLKDIEELQLPVEKEWAKNVYWMYSVVLTQKSKIDRNPFLEKLRTKGIDTRTMFCPMNQQPFIMEQKGFRQTKTPVADWLWEKGFYLPSSNRITEKDVSYMAETIKATLAKK
jgi:perosamine synthetase